MAADPSKVGHFAVAVQTNSNTAFAVYETRRCSKTWSGPATFADDAPKRHYHVSMNYSADGVLGLVWQTQQPAQASAAPAEPSAGAAAGPSGATPKPFNVWAIISRDGGASFSAPLEISDGDLAGPGGITRRGR